MKNSNKLVKKNGVILVAAMAIMLIVAVMCVVLASMLGVTARGSLDYWRSTQAFALAQGGLNWYMEQLANTADWDTTVNQSGISLNPGTFDVVLSNKASPQSDATTATRMDIAVTGKMTGSDGQIVQRTMSQRVWKLPSASKFALYWGRRTGTTLTLTNVAIDGDYWSIGTTAIPAGSAVTDGSAYYPTTENITGAGTYTKVNVGAFPYFSGFTGSTSTYSTPAINSAYYTGLMTNYNSIISACSSSSTINQNANLTLTGNTVCCRTFNTNTTGSGTVTISGNGIIVANRDIFLNTTNTNGRNLVITPSGGDILILAGRTLQVNTGTTGTHSVTISSGARMYSESLSANTQLLDVQNPLTTIDGALLIADRRIQVRNGADITGSTLFVDQASSATNNVLTVTSSGTVVGSAAKPCSLISIAQGSPALAITTSPSVVGFVYQKNATAATGFTNIAGTSSAARASITGTVIANQFTGNAISNANITYDPTAIPNPPPEGFDGFATKDPNSWSGN